MITCVILARNEQANIAACVEAARPHVGECVLIDMESSDRTVEIARPLVDRVLSAPLVANFDAARNIAIGEAKFDWLWFIDADECTPGKAICLETTNEFAVSRVVGHSGEAWVRRGISMHINMRHRSDFIDRGRISHSYFKCCRTRPNAVCAIIVQCEDLWR